MAHLVDKNPQHGGWVKGKDLPISKFIVFNDGTNFSEDALKTIYGFSYGSEIGTINLILQVTPQNARS